MSLFRRPRHSFSRAFIGRSADAPSITRAPPPKAERILFISSSFSYFYLTGFFLIFAYNSVLMSFFQRGPKENEGKKDKKEKGVGAGGPNFWGSVLTTILIFLILSSLYSFIVESRGKDETLPLSQVITDIKSGAITEIVVKGDELTLTYKDQTETKNSKKESGLSISETFKNYNVPADKLASIKVDVKNPTGFGFWFLTLAPFVLPILFIIFFSNFLSPILSYLFHLFTGLAF